MSQDERLLEYLENNKSINPLTAWRKLGIYRLSAVVFNLRQDGYKIITHRRNVALLSMNLIYHKDENNKTNIQ
jgi:hypothetical protein